MNTMIEILEIGVEEEVLQHLFPKGSPFVGRRILHRPIVSHLEV